MTPERVLRTFAELAKDRSEHPTNVLRQQKDFAWLLPGSEQLLDGRSFGVGALKQAMPENQLHENSTLRLLKLGALHKTEQFLRVGWVWIAGAVKPPDGGSELVPLG